MELNSETHTGDTIPTLVEMVCSAEERSREMEAHVANLNEARKLLSDKAREIVTGPFFPWGVLTHAAAYVDRQISEAYKSYFSDPVMVPPTAVAEMEEEMGTSL
jgi:hypothetical protein